MSAVLIIGASSAIGQALATHYLQQGLHVIWLSRYSPDLSDPKLLVIQAPDLAETADWTVHRSFFSAVTSTLQQYQVGLIFNCIGWLHQQTEPKLLPEKSLSQSCALLLRKTLQLNLEIPVMYLQGLWPYLSKTPGIRYLQLSAKVGSISDNQLGGWYSYRSAKAALNQWIKPPALNSSAVIKPRQWSLCILVLQILLCLNHFSAICLQGSYRLRPKRRNIWHRWLSSFRLSTVVYC